MNNKQKINKLYELTNYSTQKNSFKIKIKEYSDPFDIELITGFINRDYDCKIGHFGYNIYFRTSGGMNYHKYKNYKKLENAIKNTIIKNNLTPEYFLLNDIKI